MTEAARKQPRLVLLCGLPASGKTILARELADAYGAVRLNPDEWELTLGIDPFERGVSGQARSGVLGAHPAAHRAGGEAAPFIAPSDRSFARGRRAHLSGRPETTLRAA
jgi:chloramphenicol 3-O-phosphotransferase